MSSNDLILILIVKSYDQDLDFYYTGWAPTHIVEEREDLIKFRNERRERKEFQFSLEDAFVEAEKLDKDMRTEYGIRVYRMPKTEIPDDLEATDVEWIVDENGDLGVKVGRKIFILYKGASLEKTEGRFRLVEKREFGECVTAKDKIKDRVYDHGRGWTNVNDI